jgi:integrase
MAVQDREFNYTLTTSKISAAKPKLKPYPLSDGGGLFLEVLPTGAKIWRYSYRFEGKRSKVTLGPYPAIEIKEARDKHAEFRRVLVGGADPGRVKRNDKADAKAKAARTDTFEVFARVWIKETLFHRSEHTRKLTVGWLERDVFPKIGGLPLGDVRPADVLAIVESLRGIPTTANRVLAIMSAVFNYGIRKLLLTSNPTLALRGSVVVPAVEHYRPLSNKEIPGFLRALDECGAHQSTKLAVKLCMLTAVRKANVTMARWEHFDLEAREWTIPGRGAGGDGLMKMKRHHRVYLSRQALEVLMQAREISGDSQWVFPSIYKPSQPMGEATINHLFGRLYAMGVAPDFKPHGLRATASTMMNESGLIRGDVVERVLAHEQGGVRGIYNVAEYAKERAEALQWYADHLDKLCKGADVIPLLQKAA